MREDLDDFYAYHEAIIEGKHLTIQDKPLDSSGTSNKN
jgi:hypothetical protein